MSFEEEHALETYKSLIAFGTETLRALQLLNGGAIVALLAYLGQTSSKAIGGGAITWPLALFIVGLALGTLGFLTAYFTQLALFNESVRPEEYKGRPHEFWLWLSAGIATLSLMSFVSGAVLGVRALAG